MVDSVATGSSLFSFEFFRRRNCVLDSLRMAAVAVDTKPGGTVENLQKIESWTRQASAEEARLVLFQELSLTGFIPNHPVGDHSTWLRQALNIAHESAEPIPGPATDRLAGIAKKHDVLICAGMLEDAGNVLHNTQILVDGDGLLGKWRKMHVPMFEMPFYNGGDGPTVVETPIGRLGVNICFDALFPESTRLLAVQNAEIVLFPFAADPAPVTPAGWQQWAGPAIRARCIENGVYGLACNSVGHVRCAGAEQTFPGGGLAIGPRGETLAEWTGAAGQPGMLLADFSGESLQAARAEPEYLFRFRRPELYGPLAR
jgi:predicted amidohydrolase